MFSVGYGTIFLYLASVTFFFLGMFYQNFQILYMLLAALFFIIPSAIIAVMVRMRMET